MADVIVVPKHANHLVGNTLTVISRSSIAQGGIIKTVRGEAGVHTDFTQESKPLTATGNMVLIADRGDFRFKPGDWAARALAAALVNISTDQLEIAPNNFLSLQGPFHMVPDTDFLDEVPGGLTPRFGRGVLTLAGNVVQDNTVTIDGKVYLFRDVPNNGNDGEVDVGADADESISNLVAAITLGAGSGTAYSTNTTLHSTVTAAEGAGDTMDARAKVVGVAGNVATIATLADGDWAVATLVGGLDALDYFLVLPATGFISLALDRADALEGTVVDITDQGVGTHSLSGVYSFAAVPAASVADGSGAVLLPEGRDVVIQDEEHVTVQSVVLSDGVLTYFWTP